MSPSCVGLAEVAVKSTKRLLRSNIDSTVILDTDRFLRAIMQLRNIRDPDCNFLPADIVFDRPIRDAFAFVNRFKTLSNKYVHPVGAMHGSKRKRLSLSGFTVQLKHVTDRQNLCPTYMYVTNTTFNIRLVLIQNAGISQALSSKIMVIVATYSRLMVPVV